jgi:hypothetical protein
VTERLPHGIRGRCGFAVVVAILPLATVAYLVAERISRCRGHAGSSPWRPGGRTHPQSPPSCCVPRQIDDTRSGRLSECNQDHRTLPPSGERNARRGRHLVKSGLRRRTGKIRGAGSITDGRVAEQDPSSVRRRRADITRFCGPGRGCASRPLFGPPRCWAASVWDRREALDDGPAAPRRNLHARIHDTVGPLKGRIIRPGHHQRCGRHAPADLLPGTTSPTGRRLAPHGTGFA